jgi:hypothetical protein
MRNFRNFDFIFYDPRKFFAGVLLILVIVPLSLSGLMNMRTSALTISSVRDCDANAVIRCGALNSTELENRFHEAGVAEIFSSFGISAQDIANARNSAVEGQVTSGNEVMVNGQVVATNAITAGRQNMSGSTMMTSGGVTFFRRPPSVSFASSPLAAFVMMNNNDRFAFAIIASCGNPVIATPVRQPARPVAPAVRTPITPTPVTPVTPVTPTPTPITPVTPTPQQQTTTTPANNNTNTNTNTNNNTVSVQIPPETVTQQQPTTQQPVVQQQPTTTPVTPTVAATPVAAAQPTAPATQPTTLPNTGAGNVFALSGAAGVVGTVGHLLYQRRRINN